MNNAMIIGKLVGQIDTPDKNGILFYIEVKRQLEDKTDTIECLAIGRLAEVFKANCSENSILAVKGNIQVNDKKTQIFATGISYLNNNVS